MWAAADLVLAATDQELDPAGRVQLPENVRYVGVVQPPASPAEKDDPVLVSLSTLSFPGPAHVLQNVLDALDGLPVHGVVTSGPATDPAALRAPSNIEVHRVLPHADVLPGVRLVVGHGGHPTTMLALAHDAPLVILPMHPQLDQKMVGQSVEAQGAGMVLPKKASAERIRAAVVRLLDSTPHPDAAARLGARLRAQDAAGLAADHLEALLVTATGARGPAPPPASL